MQNFTALSSRKLICKWDSCSDQWPVTIGPKDRAPPQPELAASVDNVQVGIGLEIVADGSGNE